MENKLMDMIKPQLEGMQEMYRVGYAAGLAEGKRQANAEFAGELGKITNKHPCCEVCTGQEKAFGQ